MTILHVVAYLMLCAIAAFWAAAMKRSWKNWFLVALLLSPLGAYIGLIIVFFISGQPRRIGHAVKHVTQSIYDYSKESISGERPMDEHEKELYTKAASEVASKTYDPGLFAKAFSESDGDENKAKAIYLRYRVAELRRKRKESEEAAAQQQKAAILRQRIESEKAPEILHREADVRLWHEMVRQREVESLCKAVANGQLKMVKSLVGKGVDVNSSDKDGRSPLIWAERMGHSDVVEFLKQHGAKE